MKSRRAQVLLDEQIRRDKFLVQNEIWLKARLAADFAVRKDALEAALRLSDARDRHDRCKKHAHLLQKKNEYHDEKLANALKDVANAVKLAKANAPFVSVPTAFVPVNDTTKAIGDIENDSPSLLVLKKDADKGEINAPLNAQFDANEPTPLSSGEAILQAHPLSSAPSAQVGTIKMRLSDTDDDAKPSSRKDENNAQIDAQLDAQTPPSRLSSEGGVDLPQGHSSSSTTAPPEHDGPIKIRLSKGESPYVPLNAQFGPIPTNTPVGEPPPPRGAPPEHSRPRTRGYLRAQLLQEVSK